MTRLAVDTGPLVALLDRRDRYHAWAVAALADAAPLWTCDAVLSEAFFLLQGTPGTDALGKLIERGVFEALYTSGDDMLRIVALMRKFKDVPMSFADACLVRMTELEADTRVVTLDRDFLIYRRHARQAVPILAPFK